jgi:hypothetical protein
MQVFAGQEVTVKWDGKQLVDKGDPCAGTLLTFATLSYWQLQEMTAIEGAQARIRYVLTAALCAIDGSTQAVERFIASPQPSVVNNLVGRILSVSQGESEAPEASE